MCNKAINTYPSTIKFVPECLMTQEMCDKAVNRCFLYLIWYKSHEMCDRGVSEDYFSIVYCPDKYKAGRMCDEAVDGSLAAPKLIPDWFVTGKMIKPFAALYADENILYFNEDSDNVVFPCNERVILNIDLTDINLDNIFIKMTMILFLISDFGLGILNLKKRKALKKR